jgi:hypothetical protein
MNEQVFNITEFTPNRIADQIATSIRASDIKDGKGLKIVCIGPPGSGKSTCIQSIIRYVRPLIPVGIAMSGSESFNGTFGSIFPDIFVYPEYNETALEEFEQRQKLVAKYEIENKWAVCIVDDCTDTPGLFKKPIQHRLFKNGRHYNMLYLLSLQYSLDVSPAIRSSIDWTFIFRTPNMTNRKNIYDNYISVIPDFTMFCKLMDELTEDYQCIVVDNTSKSNNIEDCVFYYKAEPCKDLKFGCPAIWQYHDERYAKNE